MSIENNVVKKTNKYVYLSDGTHMSHSNYHRYKQDIRNELSIVHTKEYKNSVEVIVQSLKEKRELEKFLEQVEEDIMNVTLEIQMCKDRQATDWEKYYRDQIVKTDNLNDKLTKHARKLYKQLAGLPILNEFEEKQGIKFIIQQNYKTNEYRFCFDPYQLGANFHSTISDFYREDSWGTINGGWLKVLGDKLILYAQSGDYGVYDDNIAINAAKIIFPNKEILSQAGQPWNEVTLIYGLPL
jgi:hypothetical protein